MDQRVHVPVDDPNADTEWNDILRKHRIIPEKPPSPTPIIQEAFEEVRKQAHENRLEEKDLDELHELEDEEDEAFLAKYTRQRMDELSILATTSIHGQVYPLQKPDYARDVTEASQQTFVLVHLTSSLGTNVESKHLTEIWRDLARTFEELKFCEIRADLCIEDYPERNTPTILIYKNGDIKKQIVTLKEIGGERANMKTLEMLLISVGAIKAGDHRILRVKDEDVQRTYKNLRSRPRPAKRDDDEDDWDGH